MKQQVDVIIIGAGVVGLSLAAALKDSALSVLICDKQRPSSVVDLSVSHPRVSAITHASRDFLKAVGAWNLIASLRVSPYREMHVWDAKGGEIHFNAAEVARANLGFIIENAVLTAALMQVIDNATNITCQMPAIVESMITDEEGVCVTLANGQVFQAQCLVGADGANSFCRETFAFPLQETSYEHHAIVCDVKTTLSHENSAYQRFMQQGPLAFLPLQEAHHCSIVWSTVPEHAKEIMAMEEDFFRDYLSKALELRLGDVTAVGMRYSFPLTKRHARDYVKPHVALVGDACHTIHPLAGQGMNLGLMDAKALAKELLAAKAKQRHVGSLSTLRRYERARKEANQTMLLAMDGFKKLFASENDWVVKARGTGLDIVDKCPPLKRLFMLQAMD